MMRKHREMNQMQNEIYIPLTIQKLDDQINVLEQQNKVITEELSIIEKQINTKQVFDPSVLLKYEQLNCDLQKDLLLTKQQVSKTKITFNTLIAQKLENLNSQQNIKLNGQLFLENKSLKEKIDILQRQINERNNQESHAESLFVKEKARLTENSMKQLSGIQLKIDNGIAYQSSIRNNIQLVRNKINFQEQTKKEYQKKQEILQEQYDSSKITLQKIINENFGEKTISIERKLKFQTQLLKNYQVLTQQKSVQINNVNNDIQQIREDINKLNISDNIIDTNEIILSLNRLIDFKNQQKGYLEQKEQSYKLQFEKDKQLTDIIFLQKQQITDQKITIQQQLQMLTEILIQQKQIDENMFQQEQQNTFTSEHELQNELNDLLQEKVILDITYKKLSQ